jgi:hypothetical protein
VKLNPDKFVGKVFNSTADLICLVLEVPFVHKHFQKRVEGRKFSDFILVPLVAIFLFLFFGFLSIISVRVSDNVKRPD